MDSWWKPIVFVLIVLILAWFLDGEMRWKLQYKAKVQRMINEKDKLDNK